METASLIYSILGVLSALGVVGWIKERINLKKIKQVKSFVDKAIELADDGYTQEEIANLLKEVRKIYDEK